MKTTLLHGAYAVLFQDDGVKVLNNAYIGIKEDTVVYVGNEKPQEKYAYEKEMGNVVFMPGFYNAHTHSPMTLLRGVGSDLPLNQWLFDKVFPIEDKLTRENMYVGALLGCLEMTAGGTVSFSDMYFAPDMIVKAAVEAGLKINMARPVQSFDPNEDITKSFRVLEALDLYNQYHKADNGRVLVDFSVHAEYTCTEAATRYAAELAKERNLRMHIHLSETESEHNDCIRKYGKTPAEWFESLGAFDVPGIAAHCVWLSDNDIEILKRHDISVIHNPTSNMKLASGFADIPKYGKAGLNVALGTDGAASNNNLDMLEELHFVSVIHKGNQREATLLKAGECIRMATVNGAYAQGRTDCGEIKTGNKADIIALSLEAPHMRPCLDIPALICYSAQSADVVMTMCDGNILYENGEYTRLDKEKIYFEVNKAVKELYG